MQHTQQMDSWRTEYSPLPALSYWSLCLCDVDANMKALQEREEAVEDTTTIKIIRLLELFPSGSMHLWAVALHAAGGAGVGTGLCGTLLSLLLSKIQDVILLSPINASPPVGEPVSGFLSRCLSIRHLLRAEAPSRGPLEHQAG